MTKKYYWAIALAASFIAGTILASTFYENTAFATHQPNHNPGDDDEDMGWKAAIAEQQQQIDELKEKEILGFYRVSTSIIGPDAGLVPFQVFCDDGDVVTGGGVIGPFNDSMIIHRNGPEGTTAWKAYVSNVPDAIISVSAICADYAPEHIP